MLYWRLEVVSVDVTDDDRILDDGLRLFLDGEIEFGIAFSE